eukprot:729407-Pyramimonas_sp.AAC.1
MATGVNDDYARVGGYYYFVFTGPPVPITARMHSTTQMFSLYDTIPTLLVRKSCSIRVSDSHGALRRVCRLQVMQSFRVNNSVGVDSSGCH